MKPSINVYEIKQSQILCGSPKDPNTWPYPGAYIPGQPDDKIYFEKIGPIVWWVRIFFVPSPAN